MRALTVKQPWAWLIIEGLKKQEYRSWEPGRRLKVGERFAIHAGAEWRADSDRDLTITMRHGVRVPPALECGAVIGTVIFLGAVMDGGNWAWNLGFPKACKPVECKGQVGLWHIT